MAGKYLDISGLAYLWEKIKSLFVKKDVFESSYAEMLEGKEVTAQALNDLNSRIVDITSSPYTNIKQTDINNWNSKISSIKTLNDYNTSYSLSGTGTIYLGKVNGISLFDTPNIPLKTINREQIVGSGNINTKTSINITDIPVTTSEKLNNKAIYQVYIPIDISTNVYDNNELSKTIVYPFISPQEKYFEIGIGQVIKNNFIIVDTKLIGTCLYDNLSVIKQDNNILKMYTLLPFDNFLENLSGVLVKYCLSSNNDDSYEVINIYENTNTLVNSLWIDNYDINLTLWFDDFTDKQELAEQDGYDNWEDFVEYITTDIYKLYQENPFSYKGNTITWDNNTYYVWERNNDDESSKIALILTDTIDRSELYNHSLEANCNNEWCPYIIKSTTNELYDYGIYDSSNSNDILVKVSKVSQTVLNVVRNYGYPSSNDYENYIQDIVYNPNSVGGEAKKYTYSETIQWDNNTYYLWICDDDNDWYSGKVGILTTSRYARDLYPYSLEANPYCNEFPIVAFMNEDYEFDPNYDLEPYNENKVIKIEIE